MNDDLDHRWALLERLILAQGDMSDAVAAARFLIGPTGVGDALPWNARRALETGMFASYARPFTKSKGDPPMPKLRTRGFSKQQRETHDWAMRERNRVWAHSDRSGHRRMIEMSFSADGSDTGLAETWNPPSPEQLEHLVDLAETIFERCLQEALELHEVLQP